MNLPNKKVQTASGSQSDDPERADRLKHIAAYHPERSNLFRHAYRGESSPRQCIKAFCLECNGWEEDAISHCTITVCPLWRHRPFQRKSPTATVDLRPTRVGPAGVAMNPNELPPIVDMDELMDQLEEQRKRNEPAHFIPQRDGIY